MIERGFIVKAVGGGAIPVIEEANGNLLGTRALIDKDRPTRPKLMPGRAISRPAAWS
jgi:carbamate kinase